MEHARCPEATGTINVGELFRLSTEQAGAICGGANLRPYTGPTEIIAPGEAPDCPNGLAPNPYRQPGC